MQNEQEVLLRGDQLGAVKIHDRVTHMYMLISVFLPVFFSQSPAGDPGRNGLYPPGIIIYTAQGFYRQGGRGGLQRNYRYARDDGAIRRSQQRMDVNSSLFLSRRRRLFATRQRQNGIIIISIRIILILFKYLIHLHLHLQQLLHLLQVLQLRHISASAKGIQQLKKFTRILFITQLAKPGNSSATQAL